ncbi:hypothetical protein LM597_01575 [Candidatus Acetothermia bacterium]|nr:hypothetical protein [Candidatus Acetothermia bacterium]
MKRIRIGIIVGLISLVPVMVQAENVYINTASLFMFWPAARTIGLGGAFIALADDEATVFYNPAGLAQLAQPKTFSSSFARPFGLVSFGAVGVATRNWGGYLVLLDSGLLERRDLHATPLGYFRFTSGALLLSTGHKVSDNLSAGLQVKAYGIAFPTPAVGISISPALLYRRGAFSIGVVWRNALGIDIHHLDSGHREPWVRDIAVGLAWQGSDITLSLDFNENLITRGDLRCVQIGVESNRFAPLVLRAGGNIDWKSIGFSLFWNNLRIDFAYVIYPHLPPSFLVSLRFQ